MLFLLLGLLVSGLVIGALGRLVVPGRQPIGVGATIAVGIVGSLLGGLVARYALDWRYRYSGAAGFVISVAFTAVIIAVLTRGGRRRGGY